MLAAATLLAVLAGACAPPATAPAPTPQMQAVACPAASPAGGAGSDTSPSTDPAGSSATGAEVVVVAEDEHGRPEIVPTTTGDAASVVDELEADGTLDVVAIELPEEVSLAATSVAATDPLRSEQWALGNLGIESAWTRSRGAQVDIAVIDTGVAATHPDLRGKVCSGVAYLGGNGVAQTGKGATDPHGHGTHVAGIAAASAGDGVGIAGVAPDARIMAIRVMDAQGRGHTADVARGITWAVDHGAEVINLSLGGPDTPSMRIAVEYALSNGVVVVAAAGNDGAGLNDPSYPAAYDGAIAVASYDRNGTVSSFSTRGAYVDVAAPGSWILSTLNTGSWGRMSGTSMATPHVAGIAALLIAQQPNRTPAQVRERLESTAVDAGDPGPDPAYGVGRVRPVAALGG